MYKTKDCLEKCYRTKTDVLLSPVGKRNFVTVSDVYISLGLEHVETKDAKTDLPYATPSNSSVSKEDTIDVKTQGTLLSPIMIVGDHGSGKSTWCKYLAHCWLQKSNMGDAEMQGLNLPALRNFQILLYLSLKHSDKGLTFQELLQQYLFPIQPCCLEFVKKCMYEQNPSHSILIVIDGLDKIGKNASLKLVSELLHHKLLSSCTCIFTSRPSNFNQISDACNDRSMKIFKIREMTLEKSTTYASKVLMKINDQNNTALSIDKFLTFSKYLHLQCLLKSPYYCLILLYVWMENKNPNIEINDILIQIVENLHNHMMKTQSCKQKISNFLQGIINRLLCRPSHIKYFMYSVSIKADEIFQSELKRLTREETQCHENLPKGNNMLQHEIACELGLVTESLSLESTENISKLTFTNMLIYYFFVSNANALRKGPTFAHIVSDQAIALENSLIIHMLCQFSPATGKEIFNALGKQKNKKGERHDELNKKYVIKHTRERHLVTGKASQHEVPVKWLQSLMSRGELNDKKLLFLTNALRFTDSLSVLELENLDNTEDLIFWLPFSQTLKKLKLNISKCTLLLCQEWNNQETINLREVEIKSMLMHESTRAELAKAYGKSKHVIKFELPQVCVKTNLNEILLPRSDCTT